MSEDRNFDAKPTQSKTNSSGCLYISPSEILLENYNAIQTWMQEEPLRKMKQEDIANRYHYHMRATGRGLKESDFLSQIPQVRHEDRPLTLGTPLPISIYLDQIRSAHNVGSILRTVEAFQLGSVFFSNDTPFVDHPQVIKTAMGCAKWIDCCRVEELEMLPGPLIALETCQGAEPIDTFLFPQSFTLAVGNEERGCSEAVLKKADHVLEIPLFGRKNSLNVANAFAIVAALVTWQLR